MACLESLRNRQGYLEETIRSLVALMKSMPEGEHRNQLLDEISKLDVISVGIKNALDGMEE
jgi:hypothetical protein